MSIELTFGVGVLILRLLQILAGVLLCVLGYRLFRQMPTSDGTAEVSLTDHLKFNLSKVGPGVFFALFGAAIMIQAISSPPRLERESSPMASKTVPTQERVLIAGQRDATVAEGAVLTTEKLQSQLRFLNGLAGLLRKDLSIEQRVKFENDQREAKLALMAGAWDKKRWGDFTTFAAWAQGDRTITPNPEAKTVWETQ
jgi:hypothetical protein